jgi:hypothetical protein
MNIAITQNYVSSTNLPDVLRFLEYKPQQISGCRDRPEAVKPDRLLLDFVSALREHQPLLLTQAQEVARKGWVCDAWKDDESHVTNVEDDSNCGLESFRKRRKGTSVVEQAKSSPVMVTDNGISCNKDKGFTFSFL